MLNYVMKIYKKCICFLYKKTATESRHDIVKIYFAQKENKYKVKFTVAGMFFPATLFADDITENTALLTEFSEKDQLSILFYSSRSLYKITAIDFIENEKMLSVQASIGEKSWTKRLTLNEIMQEETIVQKLSAEERKIMIAMQTENNIIPFSIASNGKKTS
jgi:hypothetical protein